MMKFFSSLLLLSTFSSMRSMEVSNLIDPSAAPSIAAFLNEKKLTRKIRLKRAQLLQTRCAPDTKKEVIDALGLLEAWQGSLRIVKLPEWDDSVTSFAF